MAKDPIKKAENGTYYFRANLGYHPVTGIQTLSKEENLHRYEKTAFDAIVIDEAHHSAANSYKKVLDYFEPKRDDIR